MAASRRRTSRRSEFRIKLSTTEDIEDTEVKTKRDGGECWIKITTHDMKRELHQTITPVDGSVYARFELASAADIDAALDRATRAQRSWKDVPIGERAVISRRAVERMVARADQLAAELTWQMGRPLAHSPLEIRRGFEERASHMIGIAGGALADIALEPKEGFRRFI